MFFRNRVVLQSFTTRWSKCTVWQKAISYTKVAVTCIVFFWGTSLLAQQGEGDTTSRSYTEYPDSAEVHNTDTIETGTMAVVPFSRTQEENYRRALQMRVPPSARFRLDARMLADEWQAYADLRGRSPLQVLRSNLDIPSEYYIPSEQQRLLYQEQITMSRYIPGVSNGNNGMSAGAVGFQMPLSVIGRLLGLIEDVSPTITYAVEYSAMVEAVVYSTQAKVVATIFQGVQQPGRYSLTWNGRDGQGKPLPSGDYIAEVRIGRETIVRKRMQIP